MSSPPRKRGSRVTFRALSLGARFRGHDEKSWPGNPVSAHWGVPDPAAVDSPEAEKIRAFRYAYQALETRIKLFTSLRLEALDRLALQRKVENLGHLRIVPSGEPAP